MDASIQRCVCHEAQEYLQALSKDLLRLESNPSDRAALNDMFQLLTASRYVQHHGIKNSLHIKSVYWIVTCG